MSHGKVFVVKCSSNRIEVIRGFGGMPLFKY